jgi:hypothetical protein
VAATLRLADHIADGRRTAPELATATGTHPDALHRLLRYLAARGVFQRDDTGGYGLTALGTALRDDHPARLRAGLDMVGIGRADLAFVQLLHSVRTGEPGYARQFGRPFWDDLASDPARTEAFNSYMASDMPARSEAIVRGYRWDALDHVVDVGGGDGSLMVALLTAYPRLRGTVVDRPETAQTARRSLERAGLTARGDVVPGSFFDPLPAGADGYVLSLILHDWDDDAARAILCRCAQAAGGRGPDRRGAVYVIENIGADGQSVHTGMDLRMLVLYGGRERTVDELTVLAASAGLELVAVHPAGPLAIVEFTGC